MDALAVDVRRMTKQFGGTVVVRGIDLQIRRGEIFGFLGPNGSGKTTFLRMLCGLLRPDDGEGAVLGFDVMRESAAIKRQVGYMTQRFSFYEDLSVRENLQFAARMYDVPQPEAAVSKTLREMDLWDRRFQLAGELSGGWKQRLALAACLIHEPKLLLLDEPTAGVDPKARRDFWDYLHALTVKGLTVLLTTHYMDEAERCHRLACIARGKLLTVGTVEQVVEHGGIATFEIRGEGLSELAERIKTLPGVEQAVAFGLSLHVSGSNEEKLRAAVSEAVPPPYSVEQVPSRLEDVFIYLMDKAAK